jgi:hypothetical protein
VSPVSGFRESADAPDPTKIMTQKREPTSSAKSDLVTQFCDSNSAQLQQLSLEPGSNHLEGSYLMHRNDTARSAKSAQIARTNSAFDGRPERGFSAIEQIGIVS